MPKKQKIEPIGKEEPPLRIDDVTIERPTASNTTATCFRFFKQDKTGRLTLDGTVIAGHVLSVWHCETGEFDTLIKILQDPTFRILNNLPTTPKVQPFTTADLELLEDLTNSAADFHKNIPDYRYLHNKIKRLLGWD
jgi:hypothetical protein